MFQVQHLVIDEVFDGVFRDARMIENLADDDRVVRGVVVAEEIARVHTAPRHLRAREQAVEESQVEVVKDGFEVVGMSLGAYDAFAAAHLPYEMRFAREI